MLPIHSGSTNRTPLRGSDINIVTCCYKQIAATRLTFSGKFPFYKQIAATRLGYSRNIPVLQTGRPYGARVLPIPSGSTNRSPLWGSGVTDTFWFYKQVAPMGFGCSRYILVLQTGRPYGVRMFPVHSRSTNRSLLRGLGITAKLSLYQYQGIGENRLIEDLSAVGAACL